MGRLHQIGALALAICASPALATGDRERGMRLAREGRCEAALTDLAGTRAEEPEGAEALRLEGLCELRLHRYAEAAQSLQGALAAAPGRADLSLALARARFHDGDFSGAQQALDGAASLESDAEYQLYRGMLLLQRGDAGAAAAALERARSLDARRVEPVASYYLGIALEQSDQTESAVLALRAIQDGWAGTDWDREASRALARIERGRARLAFASVGAGVDYDDNAVLRGRGVPLPSDISNESDVLGVWTANAGLELWKRDEVVLGLMASFRGTTYAELQDFDSYFPGATLWLDAPLGESLRGRLRYDFGYAWQGGDSFVAANGLQASLERVWPRFGSSVVFAQASADAYFFGSQDVPGGSGGAGSACADPSRPCGPPNLDERHARDRDGFGWSAGFDHSLPLATGSLPLANTALLAGFRYAGYEARREYSFDAFDFHGGFATTLPAAVALDVVAGYTLRPYRHSTTFPDPNDLVDGVEYGLPNGSKREETTRVEVSLSRSIGEHLTLGAHWRNLDNDSTVDVFNYDQYVVGVSVTLTLTKEL